MVSRKELVASFSAALAEARFRIPMYHQGAQVTVDVVRALHRNGILQRNVGGLATVDIDDGNVALAPFADGLSAALSDCLDDEGCIGDGVALMAGGRVVLPIAQYAAHLLRPGATLGPTTVVDLLYAWKRGQGLRSGCSMCLRAKPRAGASMWPPTESRCRPSRRRRRHSPPFCRQGSNCCRTPVWA